MIYYHPHHGHGKLSMTHQIIAVLKCFALVKLVVAYNPNKQAFALFLFPTIVRGTPKFQYSNSATLRLM